MKIKLHTLILPRLEVFFLEEWIEHNLQLGVDEIYIYENGLVSHDESDFISEGSDLPRVATSWAKKPSADYFLDYTDEQIYDKLNGVVGKFPNVHLKKWHTMYKGRGKVGDVSFAENDGQIASIEDCIWRNGSGKGKDWWLFCDPDEYFVLKKHNDLREFISSYAVGVSCFYFSQRVFSQRERTKSVRSISNWGYDLFLPKSLIVDAIDKVDVHMPMPTFGERVRVSSEIALYHHYRGLPSEQGGDAHRAKKFMESEFIGTDFTMQKYLNKN
jgi:hypothetical protein